MEKGEFLEKVFLGLIVAVGITIAITLFYFISLVDVDEDDSISSTNVTPREYDSGATDESDSSGDGGEDFSDDGESDSSGDGGEDSSGNETEEEWEFNHLDWPFPDLNEKVIVVYNENYVHGKEIADYYANARGIDESHLCGVQLPTGHYGYPDELLGARKTISEECICKNILGFNEDCNINSEGFFERLVENSEITHMTLIKGIPTRLISPDNWDSVGMFETTSEGSFDYYLNYLVYRDEDIFEENPNGASDDFSYSSMHSYYSPVIVSEQRGLAYGRIEAMNKERTLDLIDRILEAEKIGLKGNYFVETMDSQVSPLVKDLTNTDSDECWDYLSYEPFPSGDPFNDIDSSAFWHNNGCERFGSTACVSDSIEDCHPDQIPGEANTAVPFALNAGWFFGETYKVGSLDEENVPGDFPDNKHNAFDGFYNMLNWHKSEVDCIELCENCDGIECEENQCREDSNDYFKEINTDCVGVSPTFIAFQLRSFPVQYYGFNPPGWGFAGGGGEDDRTIPIVLEGDSYKDSQFTDDSYLHFGQENIDEPKCILETGDEADCFENVAVSLIKNIDIDNVEINDEIKKYTFKLRYRYDEPSDVNSNLQIGLRLKFNPSVDSWGSFRDFYSTRNLEDTENNWQLLEKTLEVSRSMLPSEEDGIELTKISTILRGDIDKEIKGFLEIDGIELINEQTGQNVLEVSEGSFDFDNHYDTHQGDWAPNVIDRLGGIASWGSSSHHRTAGHAFNGRFPNAFFFGRTLGESLFYAGRASSGIIYGDPLYNPFAINMFSKKYSNLLIWKDELTEDSVIKLNVLNGKESKDTINWKLSSCGVDDIEVCKSDETYWNSIMNEKGAIYEGEIPITKILQNNLETNLYNFRLNIWNDEDMSNDYTDYTRIQYVAKDFADCPTDMNEDWLIDGEDLFIPWENDSSTYDLNGDGLVDDQDKLLVMSEWGCTENCFYDITFDGIVNVDDLLAISENYCDCNEHDSNLENNCPIKGDINLDGIIDIYDSVLISYTKGMCDRDADEVLGAVDNCPKDYNPEQEDSDGNGIGDACEDFFFFSPSEDSEQNSEFIWIIILVITLTIIILVIYFKKRFKHLRVFYPV